MPVNGRIASNKIQKEMILKNFKIGWNLKSNV